MDLNTLNRLLNITEYKVVEIISITDEEIHLRLEPYKRKEAICSGCGEIHGSGYHSEKEVIVEDLPISERRVYLHIKKRLYRCSKDGRIYVEKIEWVNKHSRFTYRFAREVSRLTAITTNQEAGWFLGLDDEVVYRIDKEMLKKQAEERLTPTPAAIHLSIDEVSYRKYHRYLTNIIDTDKRLVIWNDKGRKSEVLNRYYEGIGEENCKKVESVALDGAKHYISSTNKYAINALIVWDKFHVIQKLNQAIDKVRKQELQKAKEDRNKELVLLINCKQRFILLKNKKDLTDKQTGYLKMLCEINKPIYEAMLLKESFLEVYSYKNVEDAKECLEGWIKQAISSYLIPFIELAYRFKEKIQYILNWFIRKISSAISEGFNNKIKRLKRMAYGYKDIDYFRLKIHQHCGLLNPRLKTIIAT
jgi:transposase